MKRALISVGVVLVILIVIVVALFAPAFIGLQPIPDDFEMNGVSIVPDGFVAIGVVDAGGGQVVLIDGGLDASGEAILTEVSRRGLGPQAVAAILLSHGHGDHIAAAAADLFPNAEVMALEAEVGLAEGRVAPGSPLGRIMPVSPTGVEVTRALRDGETVQVGSATIQVYAVPGHTAGSAAYLVNGVLFLGDEANGTPDGEVTGPPWVFSDDTAQARESLVRLEQRLRSEGANVQAIAFAHSGPLVQGLEPLSAFAQANR